MKNQFRINIWVLITLVMLVGTSVTDNVSQRQTDSNRTAEIALLNEKAIKLEAEQTKTLKTVSSALDKLQVRVFNSEDNVKLQNEFLKIEFDKWQQYYLKHWKGEAK